jgi:membrane-bound ClpP family serine protease
MDTATWAFLLLLLGLLFLILEFFVPSGGSLGVLSGLCLVAAIGLGFMAGRWTGITILLTVCVAVPTAMSLAVRWWPDTPIGRLILIPRPESSDEVLPETVQYRGLKDLVGRRGLAKGLMLPSGSVLVDGKLYDAVSEGVAIEPGTAVVVVNVSTQRLVVRPDTAIRAELAESSLRPNDVSTDPNQPLVADIPDPFAD